MKKHSRKGFTYSEMLISLVILAFAVFAAVRLITISHDTVSTTKDTLFIGIYNSNIIEDIQSQINHNENNISFYEEKIATAGGHTLSSAIKIGKTYAVSGRAIYHVLVETHIGGASYRKGTTKAILTKFAGDDIYS